MLASEGSALEDLKSKWEDWYGDLMSHYEWNELEHNGRKFLYVCGMAVIDIDGCGFASNLLQVIGWADGDVTLSEKEREEIVRLLKSRHGIENVSFWAS